MLNRQKSILCLLHYAGGEASRKQLVKWCFLVSRETETFGGDAYYDFVPFRYGPYSFSLRHEVEKLIDDGLVVENEPKHWAVTESARKLVLTFPEEIAKAAKTVLRRYGNMSEENLLDSVYERYRWFTVNSSRPGKQLAVRPLSAPAVYTVGYESTSVDAFLNRLLRAGITALIDVRYNPIARRFGFHKSTLANLCDRLGIEYVHVKTLGIPSSLRCELETRDDYMRLLAQYEKEILPANRTELARISKIMTKKATALMCMEADPSICHRSRVAEALSTLTGLSTVHLKGGTDDRVRENTRPHHRPDLSPSVA